MGAPLVASGDAPRRPRAQVPRLHRPCASPAPARGWRSAAPG